jgi:hypothetical protein
MIVTFCGHSDFIATKEHENRILSILEKEVGNETAELFLGEYGSFDKFAYQCAKKYKALHSNVALVYVTPYFENINDDIKNRYDRIIYPEIEKIPKRLAIIFRNRYMIEQSDVVISYVKREYGGAYKTYSFAKKKGKIIYNLK